MQLPFLSLAILVFVILISVSQRVNIGLLSLVMAWFLGYFYAGMPVNEIMAGFPLSLFMVLVAISYFFGIANINGTLDFVTNKMILLAKGQRKFLPVIFFILAGILSTLGAGNIGAVALLAPAAMAIADKTKLGAFFMTIMIILGANAGTFSPFALTGIIAKGLIVQQGLSMNPWTQIYFPVLLTQTFIAIVSFSIFYLIYKKKNSFVQPSSGDGTIGVLSHVMTHKQMLTLLAITILIVGTIFFKVDVGFLALSLAVLLTVFGVADSEQALKKIPWDVVLMVCGVSTLVTIVEKVGGLDILITGLAKITNPINVTAIMAFIVGVISSFSSSSAVVMPTFIPLVPGLVKQMGGGDPVAIISAINVGSHVVDVSPLSTLGALCMASAAKSEDKTKLFQRLMLFGLSMSLVGAIVSYIFFGLL